NFTFTLCLIEQESQLDDGDSNNGDTHGGHSHDDDEKRCSLSLVTTALWKEHPVTTNNNHTTRFKISSQKCRLLFMILLFTILLFMILIFTILYNNYKMRELKKCCLVLQLDSNEFCTTLRLPGRVYEAGEPTDNPKAIIHHSKIDYVEKVEDILGKEEFSLIENSHIGSILKVVKRIGMPKLERVSLGTAIITEAVIMAENPSSKIPRDRLQRYMNYRLPKMAWGKTAYSILMRSVKTLSASSWTGDSYEVSGFALAINLWAMSSVNVLGKSLGKPCETSSSSDPLCLHWDSTRTPTITEVLEMEKINNVSQQRTTKDEDAEHGEDLNHSEDEEENKDEEEKTDEEQRKNKDHSMSNSEKLDKLIQMVRDLDKRVVVIQNVLGFNDGSPNKEDCENGASSESCLKQTSQVTSPTPTFTSSKFDLLSQESHSGKSTNEVLMRDICEIPVFQPLMKIKKRLVQKDSHVNEDVEPSLQKKIKADTDNVPLRRSERASLELLKLRKINNPNLFLNKTALVVGVKFLEEIYELYVEFLGEKEVVVNLEKRSITTFNCAAMKFTYASLVPYINAYAMALPFMFRNFFKDVSMDTSKFSIKIVSEGFPQVLKIEDNGVYALKLIECHAMRIVDLTKLSEEKIASIREKLAVDIFSELQ
ncbi:unnamed protein product, partial [Brassica oleracea var. botrytis]